MRYINNFVHPDYEMFTSSVRAFLPHHIIVPLCQADNTEYNCSLPEGTEVREGQIIASPKDVFSGEGANIHSSVPGVIESVIKCTLPNGNLGKACKISMKGSFTFLGKKTSETDYSSHTPQQFVDIFRSKGVVNTFSGKAVSLSTQIRNNRLKKNRFLVVRMFDEDPSRYTDSFVAEKFLEQVTEGAAIISKAFNAEGIVFMVPKRVHYTVGGDVLENIPFCSIPVDDLKYPSGFVQPIVRQAVRFASGNKIYEQFAGVNHKCLFVDPQTCLSAYEAVVKGIPVIERFVHVSGKGLNAVGMFKVRIGSSLSDLVEQCGGFKKSPVKIVINGMLTGYAINSIDIPVTKEIKSLTFMVASELHENSVIPCIRCGKCRYICPAGLLPDLLYKNVSMEYSLPKDILETSLLCAQCSLCNSVCPSRLSLSQSIKILKDQRIW